MIDQRIIDLVRQRHLADDFRYHILPVVRNAVELTSRLKADQRVVETAAYLHDIGRAGPYSSAAKDDHHIKGAKESKRILMGLGGYDPGTIEEVYHCVLAHRARAKPDPLTIEAEIVNNADAMSHFEAFPWLFGIFLQTEPNLESAMQGLKAKYERDWGRELTLSCAREIVRPRFEAIMMVLNDNLKFIDQ